MTEQPDVPAITRLALAATSRDRVIAAQEIVDARDLGASARLQALLAGHAHPETRALAAWALGFLDDADAADTLIATLEDSGERPDVRGHAAEALGHMSDASPRVLGVLVQALEDEEATVRFWAAFALGNCGTGGHIRHLIRLRNDRAVPEGWWSVGKEALDSIEQIRARAAEAMGGGQASGGQTP